MPKFFSVFSVVVVHNGQKTACKVLFFVCAHFLLHLPHQTGDHFDSQTCANPVVVLPPSRQIRLVRGTIFPACFFLPVFRCIVLWTLFHFAGKPTRSGKRVKILF